jgi:hypothetical protein
MLTEERVAARPVPRQRLEEYHPAQVREEPRPEVSVPNLLRRLVLVAIGFGLALTGWMLVILVFIGLPLFIFGLAVMQAQER